MTTATLAPVLFGDRRLPQRFWNKVVIDPSGCWLWIASRTAPGYGHLRWNGPVRRAHRVAYDVLVGPVEDAEVDHLCHVRACVNPAHLRLADHAGNVENRRGANRGNASGQRGVTWDKKSKKWRVSVCSRYQQHHGGFYDDLGQAADAAVTLRNTLMRDNLQDRGASHG